MAASGEDEDDDFFDDDEEDDNGGDDDDPDTRLVGELDLTVARELPVYWLPVEAGAPAIFEVGEKAHADVDVYRHAMCAAEVLIQLGELARGRYEYENPLAGQPFELQPYLEHGHAEMRGTRVAFEVTTDHLKLLRHLGTGVRDDGGFLIGIEIHAKRPYGEMTAFELDMGDILGIEPLGPPREDRPSQRDFTSEQLERFIALHEQMQPVLQIALQHATLTPGRFIRRPRASGRWRRTDSVH
jgi:hypothetical protein